MRISHNRWRRSNVKGGSKIFHWKNLGKAFSYASRKNVYIGKHCALKGKSNIVLEDGVTVHPYAQIWSGGGAGKNRQGFRNW